MNIFIKTQDEINKMRDGGKILANILAEISTHVSPGVTTNDLNKIADQLISKYKVKSSFLNYKPEWSKVAYPTSLCTSVNDEVVHAVPSERVLKEGDIISLDLGIWFQDVCLDSAITVGVGKITPQTQKLLNVTQEALKLGIGVVRAGVKTGAIGNVVQRCTESNGFKIIRDLSGHGVGRHPHEDPPIYNFGKPEDGVLLKPGMTIAIEPMISVGDYRLTHGTDGWAVKTIDGSYAAQFEHTVLVTEEGAEILTII